METWRWETFIFSMNLRRFFETSFFNADLSAFVKINLGLGSPRFVVTQVYMYLSQQNHFIQFVAFQSASFNGKRTMDSRTNHSGLNKFLVPKDVLSWFSKPSNDRWLRI